MNTKSGPKERIDSRTTLILSKRTMTEEDKRTEDDSSPTPLQLAFGAIILGASAGLTLYTKRTGSMLRQMDRSAKNKAKRKGPPKFGPPTKGEWEKIRPRFDNDELF